MVQQLPALLIIVPLLTALVVAMASWISPRLCLPLTFSGLALSLAASIGVLMEVIAHGPVTYTMGGWNAPMGIVYVIDYLSSPILVVITSVAILNLISARKSVEESFPGKTGAFYSLYILFTTGMIGIVATGDAFNLYVLLEIAALTGYSLIGLGNDRAPLASLNYLFIGTIGASFYLLGVGYLYIATGTLNMADLARFMPQMADNSMVLFAFIICMTGLFIKMALFPMHGWLPNAYSFSSTAATGVIAPLTTKVMIYAMIRVGLYVFTPAYIFNTLHMSKAIVWVAIAAIVMGSLLALAQKSLLKMLTYIIVAEVGYMVGGFFLGNRMGITGATLHIINDAAMTLCLFMAAGAISYKLKDDSFASMKGLFRKMPVTMIGFGAGALAVIGIPPTCGFFSKWYLITGGMEAGQYGFVAALLFSSLVNAVLFFRIFEIAHFEPFADPHDHHHHGHSETVNEAPLSMVVPLLVVAAALIVLGIYSGDIVTKIIQSAIPAGIV
ncbi:MAG: monovalent cation/H+ antiporter subunit D family protein [Proteobacteria bacterium]|nr:monovalent cation/H+ antiporter subunit D family protein [Pseudomonadota bacterium]